jgi:5-methylcytosine-specific restriction endonuclease McrA
MCCGVAVSNSRPSEAQRFCSYKCRDKIRNAVAVERRALIRIAKKWKPKPARLTKPPKPQKQNHCRQCGVNIKKLFRFCACCIGIRKQARKQTEKYKAVKRADREAYKARLKGASGAKRIDPIAVLARDGWRCQICGIATPQKLRGTHKPNAPEVDHIKPLAKGGGHTWENLQCACRACNLQKSDGAPAGQMGLFVAD